MNQIHQQLLQHISRDRLRDLTLDLVKVPSPTGDERKAIEFMARVLREVGLEVEIVVDEQHPNSPSIVARWRGRQAGRTLQFDGHIDAIHLAHGAPYYDPATGRIYGRGAADMKGSLAAITETLRALKESGIQLQGDILVTMHGMHEAPWAYGETLANLVERGYTGDAVIVTEGVSHEVPVIAKGAGIIEIDVTPKSEGGVHEGLSGRHEIPPVILAGARLVQAFAERNAQLTQVDIPFIGPEYYFVGILQGGDFYNRLPNRCRLEGTRRFGPDHAFAEVEAEFYEITNRVAAETGTNIHAKLTQDRAAFRIDPQTPVVGALQAAYQEVFGKPLPVGGMKLCADAPIFVAAGIPATYYSPDLGRAHSDVEYAVLDSLVEASKVYALVAVHFLGQYGG
jgi:acetylornithine deacetylase/succinyl-diaminopimelate desuccinylase-like protein